MKLKRYLWPAVATGTVALSVWLLFRELRGDRKSVV